MGASSYDYYSKPVDNVSHDSVLMTMPASTQGSKGHSSARWRGNGAHFGPPLQARPGATHVGTGALR